MRIVADSATSPGPRSGTACPRSSTDARCWRTASRTSPENETRFVWLARERLRSGAARRQRGRRRSSSGACPTPPGRSSTCCRRSPSAASTSPRSSRGRSSSARALHLLRRSRRDTSHDEVRAVGPRARFGSQGRDAARARLLPGRRQRDSESAKPRRLGGWLHFLSR